LLDDDGNEAGEDVAMIGHERTSPVKRV
jgi:hypothetical protein